MESALAAVRRRAFRCGGYESDWRARSGPFPKGRGQPAQRAGVRKSRCRRIGVSTTRLISRWPGTRANDSWSSLESQDEESALRMVAEILPTLMPREGQSDCGIDGADNGQGWQAAAFAAGTLSDVRKPLVAYGEHPLAYLGLCPSPQAAAQRPGPRCGITERRCRVVLSCHRPSGREVG